MRDFISTKIFSVYQLPCFRKNVLGSTTTTTCLAGAVDNVADSRSL